jgi:nematocidal protein AidA
MGTQLKEVVSKTDLKSSFQITNIQVTIDTDRLIQNFPNPSKDQNKPTGVDHSYQFMVASNVTAITGQGGADLNFAATVGDVIRLYGTSEYNNMDNAVIIYGINKFGGTNVFSNFETKLFTKVAVLPTPPNSLPPTFESQKFGFYEADVVNTGTENYTIQFAVYVRDRSQANPVLYGYFYWDPTITVK